MAQGKRILSSLASRLLDPTIVFSFDRTGFYLHQAGFDEGDLEVDLTGQICLVTGANSGIGLATSRELLRRGATVYLLCRNEGRGEAARDQLHQEGWERAQLAIVDMADLGSVRRLAESLKVDRIHILVHNAGVLPDTRQLSPQGLEMTLATHVAGPHLLTTLLLPRLRHANGRVIWVASGGMYTQALSLKDIQWEQRPYDGVVAYAVTKRAQVVLAELWAECLQGTGVIVHSMHPGWADTPAVQSSIPTFYRMSRLILRTPEMGADTVVWLAISKAAGEVSGGFWFDRKRRTTHFLPWTRESETQRRALWQFAQEICGLSPSSPRNSAPV